MEYIQYQPVSFRKQVTKNPKLNLLKNLLILLAILKTIQEDIFASGALSCSLTVATIKTIYAPSTYTFDFIQATADTSGAVKLRVVFSAASSIAPPATLACTSNDMTAFNAGGPKCTVVPIAAGGYNVDITNFLSGKNKYNIGMPTVVNPISTRSVSDTRCQICRDTNCGSINVQAIATKIDYTQDILTTYSVSSDSQITGKTGVTYTFTLITKNPVPLNGVVGLQLPQVNVNFLQYGAQASQSLIQDYEATQYSPPTITCGTGSVGSAPDTWLTIFNKLFTPQGNGKVYDELVILLNNTAIIPSLTQITVKITNCVNPPSTAPITGWGFYTADIFWFQGFPQFRYIDFGNTGTSLAMTTPNVFLTTEPFKSSLTVVDGNTLVSATGVTYRFVLQTSNDVPREAKIYIYFGTSSSSNCAVTYKKINTSPVVDSTDVECNQAQNRLEIGDLFYLGYLEKPGPIQFDIVGFTNPETTATIYFIVQTYQININAYIIDQSTTAFFMTPTTGVIICTYLQALDSTIYATTSYYITLKAQHDIKTDYKLFIKFPSTFFIKINSACITIFLGSQTVCVPDSVNNQIIISSFTNGTAITAGTTFTFAVDSIQNPGNYLSPGTVIFNLTTNAGGPVDYGTWAVPPALYTKSNITAFSVTVDDQTAGKTGAVYTISVTPKNRIAAGAYLIVYFPPQVSIPDQLAMSRDCPSFDRKDGFSNLQYTCSFMPEQNSVRISDGFSQNASFKDPPTLIFGIPQVTNPRSLLTTDMFNITIFDQYGSFLYVYNNSVGPNVTMKGVSTPNYLNYVRTSQVNGALNNYTFTFSLTNYIQDMDVFKFTLPSPIRFTDASRIYGVSYWIGTEQQANYSGDLSTAFMNVSVTAQYYRQLQQTFQDESLTQLSQDKSPAYFLKDDPIIRKYRNLQWNIQQIPANSVIDIMITNITSQPSLRPTTGSITFTAYTSQGYLIQGLNQGLSIVNTDPTVISNQTAGIVPSYFERAKFANYTLQFKPVNFEANMRILITVPSTIYIPDNVTCIGIAGVDNKDLTCIIDRTANTLNITNGFTVTTLRPDSVKIMIQQLQNPLINIITSSFQIQTYTYDDYQIDQILSGLEINFYCVYPCKSCNTSRPTQCLSCYFASDSFRYILNEKCLNTCPDGMYKLELSYLRPNLTAPTCDNCTSPCQTCGENATQCLTCIPGFLLYGLDSSCYEDITWYFPFLAAAGFFGLVVLITDCIKSSTNFLHSYIFFLAWIECGVIGFLVYLYLLGQVPGDRSLSMISFGSFAFLNIIFIPVHAKLIKPRAPKEYQEVFSKFPCTSWFFQLISYLINFKMSLLLVSNFAGRPRFSGSFDGNAWQKFNMFGLLYIVLCYLAFAADFYLYFTKYGLRKLTSFIALEAVGVMTIICLILLLEIISQCNCSGITDQDLNRAGLIKDMKGKGKKKRRAPRSGMGNDDSYGDESDQYEQYLQQNDEDEYDEEEEGEEEEEEQEVKTKGGPTSDQTDILEKLAQAMKEQSEAVEKERQRVLEEKLKLLEEKEKYFTDAAKLKEELDADRDTLRNTLKDVDRHKNDLDKHVEKVIDEKLADRQGALMLPEGVREKVTMEKEEQQEKISNLSAIKGTISDFNNTREKDASDIEFLNITEDGINGNDLSINKSKNATDIEFVNQSQGLFDNVDKSLRRDATDKELLDIGSGIYSIDKTQDGIRNLDGTEIDLMDQRSADFGKISQPDIQGSQKEFMDKDEAIFDRNSKSQEEFGPHVDQEGRSEESSEGIVADHAPFKGIKDAMANQDKLRQGEQPPTLSSEEDAEEDNRPSARRRIKQVLYSDKSESSVDDMMEDTPSNYNIANGRLEGKSMGLKAVLLFAKNQGLAMGRPAGPNGNNDGTLHQIPEEGMENINTPFNQQTRNGYNRNSAMNSSGEQSNWRALNIPMGVGSTQIVGTEDFGNHISRTVDHDMTKSKNTKSRRPEVQKQFLEPGDGSRASSHIQKNNFLQ